LEQDLRKQVAANVIAGLIVAGVVAGIGLTYSVLHSRFRIRNGERLELAVTISIQSVSGCC
jgi:hypothetical protein